MVLVDLMVNYNLNKKNDLYNYLLSIGGTRISLSPVGDFIVFENCKCSNYTWKYMEKSRKGGSSARLNNL